MPVKKIQPQPLAKIEELLEIMRFGSQEPKCKCPGCVLNWQLNLAGFDLLSWVLGGGSKKIRANIAKARRLHRSITNEHVVHTE